MNVKNYLAKFDANGNRGATIPLDGTISADEIKSYESQGYVIISAEDWGYYVGAHGTGDNGTGYIRDPKTGKPVSAPPYAPSQEERANAFASTYTARVQELNSEIVAAMADGDEELIAELKAEKGKALEAYQKALEEIKNA